MAYKNYVSTFLNRKNTISGVVYRDDQEVAWRHLLALQSQVRDHVEVLGLVVVIDETEGFAFLRSAPVDPEVEESSALRLVARRPLSFHQSLLLALLRKLAEEPSSPEEESPLLEDSAASSSSLAASRLPMLAFSSEALPSPASACTRWRLLRANTRPRAPSSGAGAPSRAAVAGEVRAARATAAADLARLADARRAAAELFRL